MLCLHWMLNFLTMFFQRSESPCSLELSECNLLRAPWSDVINCENPFGVLYINFALASSCMFSLPLLMRTDEVGQAVFGSKTTLYFRCLIYLFLTHVHLHCSCCRSRHLLLKLVSASCCIFA